MKKDYWIMLVKFAIMLLNFILGFITGNTISL